jgi:hypothetical protein
MGMFPRRRGVGTEERFSREWRDGQRGERRPSLDVAAYAWQVSVILSKTTVTWPLAFVLR